MYHLKLMVLVHKWKTRKRWDKRKPANPMERKITSSLIWESVIPTPRKQTTRYRIYLFLLNWMAKSVMTLMALFVRVISICMTPARRANVPEISKPLAFMAGSQTFKWGHYTYLLDYSLNLFYYRWQNRKKVKTHCFGGAVGSCRNANATTKVKQVIQAAACRGSERRWHCSWRCTKTSSHLLGAKRHTIKTCHPLCEKNLRWAVETHSRVSSQVSTELCRRTKQKFRLFYWWRIEVEEWRGIDV